MLLLDAPCRMQSPGTAAEHAGIEPGITELYRLRITTGRVADDDRRVVDDLVIEILIAVGQPNKRRFTRVVSRR